MSGFAGRKSGQPAAVRRRPFRAGASRRAAVLITVLLVFAGHLASLGVWAAPAAGAAINGLPRGCGAPGQVDSAPLDASTSNPPACGVTITQTSPTAGTTTTTESPGFTDQLATTGQIGLVTLVTTSVGCGVEVSVLGVVTTSGPLRAGHCTVSGTDSDLDSDTGTWTYALSIDPVSIPRGTIVQRSSMTGRITASGSGMFKGHLDVAGQRSPVSYVSSSKPCGVAVSPSGVITTTRRLAAGQHCTVWGTVTDFFGDSGTWTFTLTIAPAKRHRAARR